MRLAIPFHCSLLAYTWRLAIRRIDAARKCVGCRWASDTCEVMRTPPFDMARAGRSLQNCPGPGFATIRDHGAINARARTLKAEAPPEQEAHRAWVSQAAELARHQAQQPDTPPS